MRVFIKFVLITFLIVMLLRLFFKVFLPDMFRKFVKNFSGYEQNQNINIEDERKKEGEIFIKKNSASSKNGKTETIGEYVDYEEIKD